jgi:hypothetical protein
MCRIPVVVVSLALALTGCSRQPAPQPRITQFRITPSFIPTGLTGRLCYGVENATKLELNPPVEAVLPASEYCIDITPKQTTTYTLMAYGKDGGQDMKSIEVKVGPPAPRISNLSASSTAVKRGAQVKVCFKVENANSVKAKPGKLNKKTNCLIDYPRKTTTYRITALGQNGEEDSGTLTVQVTR